MCLRTVLFVIGLLLVVNAQVVGQPDSLTRIPTRDLSIPLPGVAVIRDAEKWTTLWHRFGGLRWHAGEKAQAEPPAVDFSRHMLVAVSYGSDSGCSNEARYIGDVRVETDSIAVVLGGTENTRPGPVVTCGMVIEPVDVVRLPRTELPVNFVSSRIPVPHWARWWAIPSAEELARMEPEERRTFLEALALDPSISETKLQEIADHLTENDWSIAGVMIERPEVQRNPTMLLALSAVRGTSEKARRLLLEEHGLDLASDRETERRALELLLAELRYSSHPVVAAALLDNPMIRNDRELFARFVEAAQRYRKILREACDLYLERWPPSRIGERNAAGDPVQYAYLRCAREAPREPPQEPPPREGMVVPLPILLEEP